MKEISKTTVEIIDLSHYNGQKAKLCKIVNIFADTTDESFYRPPFP